jgi:hypothetical protein
MQMLLPCTTVFSEQNSEFERINCGAWAGDASFIRCCWLLGTPLLLLAQKS